MARMFLGNPPPYVSEWIKKNNKPTVPLTFTAVEENSSIQLNKKQLSTAIPILLETSTDDLLTWTSYNWNDISGDSIELRNIGDSVSFRAIDENQNLSGGYRFSMTGKISASGSILSLLKSDCKRDDVPKNCYSSLFLCCNSLLNTPDMPALSVAEYGYDHMFYSCKSLTNDILLPAKYVNEQSYYMMFFECLSLSSTPVISALVLTPYSVTMTFNGSEHIKNIIFGALSANTRCFGLGISGHKCMLIFPYIKHIEDIDYNLMDSGSLTIKIGKDLEYVLSGSYSNIYSLIYDLTDNDTPKFDLTQIPIDNSSTSKGGNTTYNISTDNTAIKEVAEAKANEKTIVNVYHLNGEPW